MSSASAIACASSVLPVPDAPITLMREGARRIMSAWGGSARRERLKPDLTQLVDAAAGILMGIFGVGAGGVAGLVAGLDTQDPMGRGSARETLYLLVCLSFY